MALVAAIAVAAPFAVASAHSVRAEDQDAPATEVPLGAFSIGEPQNGFSVIEAPSGVPQVSRETDDGGSNRWFFDLWQKPASTDFAKRTYGEAMRALDAGRVDEAQRLFERLIAEAPRSAQAGEARRHLGRIYSGEAGTKAATASKADSPATAEKRAEPQPPAPPVPRADNPTAPSENLEPAPRAAGLDLDPPLARSALIRARVPVDVDGKFLAAAGDRVFFGAGSAGLGTRAQSVIQAQARFLNQNPSLAAAIEGHADDGALPEEETRRLSDTRAAVVRDQLIALGVAPERLVAYGRGRDERVSDCPESECLAQNRRVITILLQRLPNARARVKGSASAGPNAPAAQFP